jgi:AraC family L-rhamnose operon regulatory protein RhaS
MSYFKEIVSFGHIENKLMYPHCNPGMELVLVEQGRLEWAVEQVPEVLRPGTVYFTLPWQMHGSLQIREPRNKIYYALFGLPGSGKEAQSRIQFPDSLRFADEEAAQLSRIFTSASRHAWPASDLLKEMFQELIRRLGGTSKLDGAASVSLLRCILVELADIISNTTDTLLYNAPTVQKVHAFLQAVGQQLDRTWTLEEMAGECGIKRTQFAKITRHLTGYPPLQYLNRIRFEKACELLGNSDSSITDIAFGCGYATSQYFAETFKKQARMTPSEYRKSLPELNTIMRSNWSHPEWRSVVDEHRRATLIK